jgi:RNA polymerase sigma-70 factor (ECF subfamily)
MGIAVISQREGADGRRDEEVVVEILRGATDLFEVLMRRHDQRLFRVIRSIVADDGEAEDVMQDTYVHAYQHLAQFEGRARFSTWLIRIAVRDALARVERRGRFQATQFLAGRQGGHEMSPFVSTPQTPEEYASTRETASLLESAILALPLKYRGVLMMRDIEGMSVEETACSLAISKVNVKVRLHRARALMRRELYSRAHATSSAAFKFLGVRCDRIVKAVLERLTQLEERSASEIRR